MNCSKCNQAIAENLSACPHCSQPVNAENPYAAPVTAQVYQPVQDDGRDATGGVIPYNNPKALIAYYCGIVSGLPLIGLPFGIAAFVLGIMGLRDRKRNPAIKGSAHAWVGIGCGGLFSLLWLLAAISMIVAMIAR